ncbi:MAG: hypothetical protein KDD90_04815, partial [Sphingomonadaceae bacterium]|nr:hypothetical protein [Sphingomonadaceae bacterium]
SAGLGAETARVLGARGARVIMGVRDLERGERVVDAIRDFALPIADARHARTTTSVPVQGKTR